MVDDHSYLSSERDENELSQRHELSQRILQFEREWTRHTAEKEEAIRKIFGFSATRYYHVLETVIDSPVAYEYDPLLVKRLTRLRDARTTVRKNRVFSDRCYG